MKPISLLDVRRTTGARSVGKLPVEVPSAQSICTDTRKPIEKDCLFIGLRGENFDGNAHARAALDAGALAVLVDKWDGDAIAHKHIMVVPDTRKAMGKLATFVRATLAGKVIAVGGSNGKTSTKGLIDAACAVKLRGTASPKSFNNDIGVPLTIFATEVRHEYCVLELGTNHPGETKLLSEMCKPDVAVITNCGSDHLEFLGDLMGVRNENAQITAGLDVKKGLLVVHGDDSELIETVSRWPGRRLTFGFGEKNDLYAADVFSDETGVRFKLNGRLDISLPLLGRHNVLNALAAIACARRCGVSEEEIAVGLAKAKGAEMRLERRDAGGITVINDAYNANPDSMQAALETVAKLPTTGKRVAVLGDMKELGAHSQKYHREIGALVAALKFDVLVCVGTHAGWIAESAKAAGMPANAVTGYGDSAVAAMRVPMSLVAGDVVLLKASRGMQLEKVAEAIGKR